MIQSFDGQPAIVAGDRSARRQTLHLQTIVRRLSRRSNTSIIGWLAKIADRLQVDDLHLAGASAHADAATNAAGERRLRHLAMHAPDQHLFLRAGVNSMPGFRFGKPVTASEIDDRLAAPEAYLVASPDQEIAIAS